MKSVALVAGIFFLFLGIAGFIPAFNIDGHVFGVLPENTVYSVIYIVAGAAGVIFGLSPRKSLTPPPSSGGHDLRNFSGL
jgi:uncharacterized membrane protein YuzA (DUF378 family)